ncbi:hypothetical protein KIL84_009255 [Mauremys mutica]|uniref:Uncharacterized protein n=1 Tax=Mauremys mutica TaxID=74926 RepID=A0A9D4B4S3_9SAUR|nr:hypothetical protein KIL84_009255 [Mauremys mutica]
MGGLSASAAFREHLRRLCLGGFPCGAGSWVRAPARRGIIRQPGSLAPRPRPRAASPGGGGVRETRRGQLVVPPDWELGQGLGKRGRGRQCPQQPLHWLPWGAVPEARERLPRALAGDAAWRPQPVGVFAAGSLCPGVYSLGSCSSIASRCHKARPARSQRGAGVTQAPCGMRLRPEHTPPEAAAMAPWGQMFCRLNAQGAGIILWHLEAYVHMEVGNGPRHLRRFKFGF